MDKKRSSFSKEFKLEAVRLCNESGKSLGEIARQLDMPRNTLARWRSELRKAAGDAFRSHRKPTVEIDRIRQLELENQRLRRERDILKADRNLPGLPGTGS